jgi:hypothetical protein
MMKVTIVVNRGITTVVGDLIGLHYLRTIGVGVAITNDVLRIKVKLAMSRPQLSETRSSQAY